MHDWRLCIPAASCWLAAVLAPARGGASPWLVSALLLGAAVLLLWGAGSAGRRRLIAVTLALVALTLLSVNVQLPARQPVALLAAAESGRTVMAQLTVTGHCRLGQHGEVDCPAVLHRLSERHDGSVQWQGHVPVRLALPAAEGGRTVELRHAAEPGHAAEPSRAAALPGFGSGISAAVRLSSQPPEREAAFWARVQGEYEVAAAGGILSLTEGVRQGLRDAVSALPGDGAALLPGLSIGDTTAVDDALDAAMKASSLSHLTAVSGANCALVVALVFLAARRFGAGRILRLGLAAAALLAFVLLVTPEPSVLRAGTMALLVLAAQFLGRGGAGLRVLAAAVLLLVLIDPWLAATAGFVLSVFATFGLLVLAGPLGALLSRVLPRALAVAIALPLAAQLACQPVLILLEPSIPLAGVPANLLAAPAAPLATVLGLLVCLLQPFAPPLALLPLWLGWLPASWIAACARAFADWPRLPWPPELFGMLSLAALTGLCLLALLAASRRQRRMARLVALLALAAALGSGAGAVLARQLGVPGDWLIAACDVGQGDAVLLQDRPGGERVLVDTGDDEQALQECLELLGVQQLAVLVLTHFDADHVGAAPILFGRVGTVLHGPIGSEADAALLRSFARHGAELRQASRGERGSAGGLRWTLLWPPPGSGSARAGNDASLAMRFEHTDAAAAPLSSLFLGDLGADAQYRLALNADIRPVQLVKVAHHGSADQEAQLYHRAAASIGLISSGAGNRYGHPRDELLQLLADSGTAAVRTDERGTVLLRRAPQGSPVPLLVWSRH